MTAKAMVVHDTPGVFRVPEIGEFEFIALPRAGETVDPGDTIGDAASHALFTCRGPLRP